MQITQETLATIHLLNRLNSCHLKRKDVVARLALAWLFHQR